MSRLRAALALIAVVVAAWFGLGAVQARDTDRATAALTSTRGVSAHRVAQVTRWLNTAAVLNPDQTIALLRGRLQIAEGHLAAARDLIGAVTRSEPQNLEAWVAMASASADDLHEFLIALHHVRTLEPRIPGQRS